MKKMIKTIRLPKAGQIGTKIVDSLIIEVIEESPNNLNSLQSVREFYDHKAEILSSSLLSSLPQGIIDPLIIKLMQSKVSVYCGLIERG